MAQANWRLEGEWLKNCTCAYGCPCDFNAKPTQGYCKGFIGMRITKGHFDSTTLDGLCFFAVVSFPGPLHEGNGQLQPIIEERATAEQREALFNIMSGKNSAEGTLFQICSLIVTKMHDPIFAPITFQFDKSARTARLVIPRRARNRGGTYQEPGDRCPPPSPNRVSGGVREPRGRGGFFQHPQHRGHQVRDAGWTQHTCLRRADTGRCGSVARAPPAQR